MDWISLLGSSPTHFETQATARNWHWHWKATSIDAPKPRTTDVAVDRSDFTAQSGPIRLWKQILRSRWGNFRKHVSRWGNSRTKVSLFTVIHSHIMSPNRSGRPSAAPQTSWHRMNQLNSVFRTCEFVRIGITGGLKNLALWVVAS